MTPWTADSGTEYQLCLLDTNALSGIVRRLDREGQHFVQRFPPARHIPCFQVYSLFELRRRPDIWGAFVKFFSVYPAFLLKPFNFVVIDEVRKGSPLKDPPLWNAFSPLGKGDSYKLEKWVAGIFKDPSIKQLEASWRTREREVWEAWKRNKMTFKPRRSAPNALDARDFVKGATPVAIAASLEAADMKATAEAVTRVAGPALQTVLYSQYYRVFDEKRRHSPSDVTDVEMAAVAPYMDVVITEAFQAEILKRIRHHVPGLSSTVVLRAGVLRRRYTNSHSA